MRSALELGLPVFLIRDTNAKGELVQSKGPKRRVDRIEFLEDDPISGNLGFTFSLGGRRVYQLPADEEGSCFQARETTKKEVVAKKRSQAAFRAAVLRRYGIKQCPLCGALAEVIEAAHIVPSVKTEATTAGTDCFFAATITRCLTWVSVAWTQLLWRSSLRQGMTSSRLE